MQTPPRYAPNKRSEKKPRISGGHAKDFPSQYSGASQTPTEGLHSTSSLSGNPSLQHTSSAPQKSTKKNCDIWIIIDYKIDSEISKRKVPGVGVVVGVGAGVGVCVGIGEDVGAGVGVGGGVGVGVSVGVVGTGVGICSSAIVKLKQCTH
jgi:hypothetical protein